MGGEGERDGIREGWGGMFACEYEYMDSGVYMCMVMV